MNEALEATLIKRFPHLYKPGNTPQEYLYWGFEFDDGWYDLIYRLSLDLTKIGFNGSVLQVKEKYAGLR